MDKQKDFCTTKCRSLFYFQAASRACGADLVLFFGQMAMRSARARGRAGFFFELVLALVARGMFYLTVKWLALRAGQRQGWFFFELVLALVARGGFYSFGQMALRSARARGRAGFSFKLVLALVARGRFFLLVKWLCAPRGPEAELVFSLSWFSRWWRGGCFFFWSNGFALRAGQR